MRRALIPLAALVLLAFGSPVARGGGSITSQEVAPVTNGKSFATIANAPEPAGEDQAGALDAAIGVSVKGITFTGVVPPDTVGEVGTSHFVQMTNSTGSSRVEIFDKNGANVDGGELADLAPDGSDCMDGIGDPIVLFDQLASRWLLTEFHGSPRGVCAYVSSGSDPVTSTWNLYEITTPFFPDYPKYSVMPDAYYMATNEAGDNAPAYAFDRTEMLAGDTATIIRSDGAPKLGGFIFQALAPVDIDGAIPTPDDTTGIFVRHVDEEIHAGFTENVATDVIEVWEFDPDFTTPANSTFTNTQDVVVDEFDSTLCGTFSLRCFRQKGTKQKLDPLREVVMHRPTLRVFGAHQSMTASFVTDIGNNRGGLRWVELRRAAAGTTGGWSSFQEGTVGGGGFDRWMSSIAMNGDGDIGLGYSVTSRKIFPRINVTGRLVTDAAGTMQPETVVAKSKGAQTFSDRWGDYTAMSVDPSDDETFWYTNQYLNKRGRWRTRIASFTIS